MTNIFLSFPSPFARSFPALIAAPEEIPKKKPFCGCFVINGEGYINGLKMKAGQSFMITKACEEFVLEGEMDIISCHG
jgi:mannose-6-phosphate isomerase class I